MRNPVALERSVLRGLKKAAPKGHRGAGSVLELGRGPRCGWWAGQKKGGQAPLGFSPSSVRSGPGSQSAGAMLVLDSSCWLSGRTAGQTPAPVGSGAGCSGGRELRTSERKDKNRAPRSNALHFSDSAHGRARRFARQSRPGWPLIFGGGGRRRPRPVPPATVFGRAYACHLRSRRTCQQTSTRRKRAGRGTISFAQDSLRWPAQHELDAFKDRNREDGV